MHHSLRLHNSDVIGVGSDTAGRAQQELKKSGSVLKSLAQQDPHGQLFLFASHFCVRF